MFDSLAELTEKISLGEDSTIEFKRELPERKRFADEMVAFANTNRGVILIGVDDDGTIVGIDSQEMGRLEETVFQIGWNSIVPAVPIITKKWRIDDKNLLKIDVFRSQYVHRSSNGYFIRYGSSKRKMPTEESVREFQTSLQGRIIPFDEQLVPNTNKDILKEPLYQRFITAGAAEQEQIEDLLLNRRLLVEEGQEYHASVAGMLMCHDSTDDYIYNSFIQAVCYSGIAQDVNQQIEAKDFKGPLDQQILDAFKFVQKYNPISAHKQIDSMDQPQYSMSAIFEAIVNAVVHRDYSKHESTIRLFMFADRLELYSPGTLVNGLTVDDLPRQQATRNKLLSRLFLDITLDDDISEQVDRRDFLGGWGDGVDIIFNQSERLSGRTPIYQLFGEELRLTIFAAKSLQAEAGP